MTLFEMKDELFRPITEASFSEMNVRERGDLQRLLRTQIDVIDDELYVLAEEFSDWEDSKRRIDLLALDKQANLVVIELKRTSDGGHMELQAVRYASMISNMTFEQAVRVHGAFLTQMGEPAEEAEGKILDFLDWDEPDEDSFADDIRIILVSEDFGKELTTAVLWLRSRDLDIRCVRLKPYQDEGKKFIDVQQIIPLPEAEDYQVQLREKEQKRRSTKKGDRWDETKFLAEMERNNGKDVREAAEEMFSWLAPKVSYPWFGYGVKDGGVVFIIRRGGIKYHVCRMSTQGRFVFGFDWLSRKVPFSEESVRKELLGKINSIPGVKLKDDVINRRGRIPFEKLTSKEAMSKLQETVLWLIEQIPRD